MKEATVSDSNKGRMFMRAMILAVNQNNFDEAKKLFDEFRLSPIISHDRLPSFYSLYFKIFRSKEHLSHLKELVNDLRSRNSSLSESAYLALIHCHCDAGEPEIAWQYAKEMEQAGFENRVRIFQPFLMAYEQRLNVQQQLNVMEIVRKEKLTVRTEQLETILRTYAKLRIHDPHGASAVYPAIKGLLHSLRDFLQGISGNQLEVLASIINKCSPEQTNEMGLLVEQTEEMERAIVSKKNLTVDGSVLAYNISFLPQESVSMWSRESIPIPRMADPYLPEFMRECDRLEFLPERFVVKAARQKCLTESQSAEDHAKWEWESQLDARQVSIPTESSRCPHCLGKVNNLPLRDSEKQAIRTILYKAAVKMHPKGDQYLQEFEKFLENEKEFEYIIDGANVGYNNQNYFMGRFSYGQIRIVWDELRRLGKRVLIIIPRAYNGTTEIIPNTVRSSVARSIALKTDEINFMQDLAKQNAMYTVPNGMNDDIFWMLAAVYSARKQPCLVVTNDFMRDHAADSEKYFTRFRTSSIVYFSIVRNELVPKLDITANPTKDESQPTAKNNIRRSNKRTNSLHNSTEEPNSTISSKRLSAENLAQHNRDSSPDIDDLSTTNHEENSTSPKERYIPANPYITYLDDDAVIQESRELRIKLKELSAQKNLLMNSKDGHSEDAIEDTFTSSSSGETDETVYAGRQRHEVFGGTGNFGGDISADFQRNREQKQSSGQTDDAPSPDSPRVAGKERKERRERTKLVTNMFQDKQAFWKLAKADDFNHPGQVTFFKPGNFSRDMQEAEELNRWHIPATDKMKWLCVKLAP
jgi:pentatricopeptide repeat protein